MAEAKAPITLVVDIDGVLLKHWTADEGHGSLCAQLERKPELLSKVKHKFVEWDRQGFRIILLTGRPESCREQTIKQLESFNLFWQQLVMGVGGGPRILINDFKPERTDSMAAAINIPRNKGLEDIDLNRALEAQKKATEEFWRNDK